MNPKLGIIIVTYNSRNDIIRLLDSILIQGYSKLIVYIVDNNSSDDTLSLIYSYQTKLSIIIIDTGVNNGYAAGNNIGIRKAMNDGCDLVFILNPDMQLEDKCIKTLIDRIKNDERIGVIGPIVLFGDVTNNLIQGFGTKVNFKTQKKEDYFSGEKLTEKLPLEIYADLVLGGAMMIRSSALKNAGLFEEKYFMYNDEIDISYRIKLADYKILAIRKAIVRHFHNFQPQNLKSNNLMYYYMMRNRIIYFRKFKLYRQMIFDTIYQIGLFPIKLKMFIRKKSTETIKYYYLGLFYGLIGEKGFSKKEFE